MIENREDEMRCAGLESFVFVLKDKLCPFLPSYSGVESCSLCRGGMS